MSGTAPSNSMPTSSSSIRSSLGLMDNARKNKKSFVQFFIMTGILTISLRSLGQKYRVHDLTLDIADLREEGESLSLRMAAVKDGLLDEARKDPSGILTSHLRSMFKDNN